MSYINPRRLAGLGAVPMPADTGGSFTLPPAPEADSGGILSWLTGGQQGAVSTAAAQTANQSTLDKALAAAASIFAGSVAGAAQAGVTQQQQRQQQMIQQQSARKTQLIVIGGVALVAGFLLLRKG